MGHSEHEKEAAVDAAQEAGSFPLASAVWGYASRLPLQRPQPRALGVTSGAMDGVEQPVEQPLVTVES